MSKKPILLFLHGVGKEPGDEWAEALDGSLRAGGFPGLSEVRVIAPTYPNSLFGVDESPVLPEVTVPLLRGEAARSSRREFDWRRTAVEEWLGSDDRGRGLSAVDQVAPALVAAPPFRQAKNYLSDRKVRAAVLNLVHRRLPSSGRLCIVAHSLGSVIAADLLRRLPPDLVVSGVVTIGSPLAHGAVRPPDLEALLEQPPTNIAWWVNFWSRTDPVPAGRGLSAAFPWVIDRCVTTSIRPKGPRSAHGAASYTAEPTVARTLGTALFGSRSTALAVVDYSPAVQLDPVEAEALLKLRYAHNLRSRLDGERSDRYGDAVRRVQHEVVRQIASKRAAEQRPLPTDVSDLVVDMSAPVESVRAPDIAAHVSKDDALVALLSVATSNVIDPFEIKVGKEVRRAALEQLAVELRLGGSRPGRDVADSLDEAQKALKGSKGWVKWTALGVGAVALTAATGGLWLAAAPGAAGAAAVTSALAAFGPGGMVGGLVTAGTLAGVGGGGVVYGVTSPGASAEAVEAFVVLRLALALLRERQRLEPEPRIWSGLVEMRDVLTQQIALLESISDESAESVKLLRRKFDSIQAALDYLRKRELGPAPYSLPVGLE